jgi:hypothetical protein
MRKALLNNISVIVLILTTQALSQASFAGSSNVCADIFSATTEHGTISAARELFKSLVPTEALTPAVKALEKHFNQVPVEISGWVTPLTYVGRYPFNSQTEKPYIIRALKMALSRRLEDISDEKVRGTLRDAVGLRFEIKDSYVTGFPEFVEGNKRVDVTVFATLIANVGDSRVQLPVMLRMDLPHPSASSPSPLAVSNFITGPMVTQYIVELRDSVEKGRSRRFNETDKRPVGLVVMELLVPAERKRAEKTNEVWLTPTLFTTELQNALSTEGPGRYSSSNKLWDDVAIADFRTSDPGFVTNAEIGSPLTIDKTVEASLAGRGLPTRRSPPNLPTSSEFTARFFAGKILLEPNAYAGQSPNYQFALRALRKYPHFFTQFGFSVDTADRIIMPTIYDLNRTIELMNMRAADNAPGVRFYEETLPQANSEQAYFPGFSQHPELRLPLTMSGKSATQGSLLLYGIFRRGLGYMTLPKSQTRALSLNFQFLAALKSDPILSKDPQFRSALENVIRTAVSDLNQAAESIAEGLVDIGNSFGQGQLELFTNLNFNHIRYSFPRNLAPNTANAFNHIVAHFKAQTDALPLAYAPEAVDLKRMEWWMR